MDTTSDFQDNKLPQGLNVLTILTLIGCAIAILGGIWGFINADKSVAVMQEAMNNPDTPAFSRKFMTQDALDNARLMATNKLPLLILGLVASSLCLFGAVQMRQRKMNGYYLWLTGEILPFITSIIFINVASVYKGYGAMIVIGITLLFIILYTSHRKYLINK